VCSFRFSFARAHPRPCAPRKRGRLVPAPFGGGRGSGVKGTPGRGQAPFLPLSPQGEQAACLEAQAPPPFKTGEAAGPQKDGSVDSGGGWELLTVSSSGSGSYSTFLEYHLLSRL